MRLLCSSHAQPRSHRHQRRPSVESLRLSPNGTKAPYRPCATKALKMSETLLPLRQAPGLIPGCQRAVIRGCGNGRRRGCRGWAGRLALSLALTGTLTLQRAFAQGGEHRGQLAHIELAVAILVELRNRVRGVLLRASVTSQACSGFWSRGAGGSGGAGGALGPACFHALPHGLEKGRQFRDVQCVVPVLVVLGNDLPGVTFGTIGCAATASAGMAAARSWIRGRGRRGCSGGGGGGLRLCVQQ